MRVIFPQQGLSPKRRMIAAMMESAIDAFLAVGAPAITEACNQRRTWLLAQVNASATFLSDHGLGTVPTELARIELNSPFDLKLPSTISVEFIDAPFPGRPDMPMGTLVDVK